MLPARGVMAGSDACHVLPWAVPISRMPTSSGMLPALHVRLVVVVLAWQSPCAHALHALRHATKRVVMCGIRAYTRLVPTAAYNLPCCTAVPHAARPRVAHAKALASIHGHDVETPRRAATYDQIRAAPWAHTCCYGPWQGSKHAKRVLDSFAVHPNSAPMKALSKAGVQ